MWWRERRRSAHPPAAGSSTSDQVVRVGQPIRSSTGRGAAMATVPTLRGASKDRAPDLPDLPEEVRLALTEAAASAREGLLTMSVATGLTVVSAMMQVAT